MKTKIDETTVALLIWDTRATGNEILPIGFFGAVEADPYAETARFAKHCKRPHILTRGIQEVLAVFDGAGERCSDAISPADFMRRAKVLIEGGS